MIIKKNWVANLLSILGGLVFGIQLWEHAHFQYSQLDEGAYAVKGLLFATGKYVPYQEYGPWTNHMPLSFLIPGYIQVLFGPGLRTIRYFSIILALLALVAIWITARRLGGYWWGAGAVWIYASSPAMARFYSQATSQVLIFFMLAWVLALVLGENLPAWKVFCGSMLVGIIFLTRINMAPVLVFLLGYIFWQYGWRRGLIATLLCSMVVAIGLAWYWPGIYKYMLSRYPLADASMLTYVILLVLVGVIGILWLKREKFIHHPIFKGFLWGSFFIILLVLYLWSETDGGAVEHFTTILLPIGYHLLIVVVLIFGYYLWKKRREKKAPLTIPISAENYWKYYFLLAFIESVGALVVLFLLPTDPKNAWLLGYSPSRVGLIAVVFCISILPLWLAIRTWNNPSFESRIHNWVVSWRQDKKIFLLVCTILIGAIIISIFMALQALIIIDMAIKAPLVRLTPFFVLIFLNSIQTLLLISIGLDTHSNTHRFLFDIFTTLLCVFIILHLDPNFLASSKLRSFNASVRSHFIPLFGLIFMFIFWPGRKNWKNESHYRIGVVLSGLFITLILIHLYATIGTTYCVHCLQPYFAFFSQIGVVLLILAIPYFGKKISRTTQVVTVVIILWGFTGLGFVLDFHTGLPLLGWTYLFIAFLAGLKFIFNEKKILLNYSLSALLAVSCLGIGLILSPTQILGGGYQNMDCDVDIISYYETFGEELNRLIPEGAQVFWWGSSPTPLLSLPERNIYPAQLNSTAYKVGGNTEDLVKRGFWNDLIGQQWVLESDFLILLKSVGAEWLLDVIDGDQYTIVLEKPVMGTCQRELDYLVYQHLP